VGWYALVAALAYGVAGFLTWGRAGETNITGWERADGTVGDGPFVAGLATLAFFFALALVLGRSGRVVRIGLVVIGLLATALALFELADVLSDEVEPSIAEGIWILIASGASLAVSGVLATGRRA
jgi:hypothetical protein